MVDIRETFWAPDGRTVQRLYCTDVVRQICVVTGESSYEARSVEVDLQGAAFQLLGDVDGGSQGTRWVGSGNMTKRTESSIDAIKE